MKKALTLTLLSTALILLLVPGAHASAPKWQVTLSASPTQVRVNQTVVYSGVVKTASGKPASGSVVIQKRPASGGVWKNWQTVRLRSNGSYRLAKTMTLVQISQVRARKAANAANRTGFSASRRITVRSRPKWQVGLSLSRSQIIANERVVCRGTVKTAAGRPAGGSVIIQRRLAGSDTWKNWRTAGLNSRGSYAISVRMTVPGRIWQVRAKKPAGAGHRTGFSATRKLTVAGAVVSALSSAGPAMTTLQNDVVTLVNRERIERGLGRVSVNASLTAAACDHSSEMARRNTLSHTSANGDSVGQRLTAHGYSRDGYSSWSVGENIARAVTNTLLATPQGIVQQWMDSAAHRAVILKAEFRDVGIGIATSSSGMRYYTLDMGQRTR